MIANSFNSFSTKDARIDEVDLTIPSDIEAFVRDHKTSHFIPCNESRATFYNLKHMKEETPSEVR